MARSRICACVLCAILTAVLAALALLSEAPVASAAQDPKPVSFINDVAPILKENCYACHDSKKRSGKLEITSYAKIRQGGSNDDPIAPGKPDDSLLIQLLTSDGARRMPPSPPDKTSDKDGALPLERIAVIQRWIQEGAKLDADVAPEADLLRELRKRWQPPLPPVRYPLPVMVTALAFTSDGKRLLAAGHHEFTVWDAAEGKLLQRVRTRAERSYAFAFLADDKLVVAGGRPGQEGDVRIYDLGAPPTKTEDGVAYLDGVSDPKVLVAQLLETDDAMLCLALSPDGKMLAAGGCDRQVRVWDLSGGVANARLDQTVENHADWVLGVALSPDGKHLVTASRDKTAKVWDLVKREPLATFSDHQNSVYCVAFKADGKVAFSVGADKTLRLWRTSGDGKQIRAVGGHGDDVYKVVSHAGQVVLATCSADKTVRLWKEDGNPLRTLTGLSDQVYSLAISPDGNLVAAGAWDGEVRVWRVADGQPVKGFNASPGYQPKR